MSEPSPQDNAPSLSSSASCAGSARSCQHKRADIYTCGVHYEWCGNCGAIRRIGKSGPLESWQIPDQHAIVEAADNLENYLWRNVGSNDEWPIEVRTASDEAGELARLLGVLRTALSAQNEKLSHCDEKENQYGAT